MHKLYISLKYYIKTLKILLQVSILRLSSRNMYCSSLKLHVKIMNMSLYLSVMWQHIVCSCMRWFQCRGVCWLASQSTYPLHWKQRIHKHTICCHITDKYNNIFTILTCNFSKEHYVLPEDDLRIESWRSIWCGFDRASSIICGNKMPTRCNRWIFIADLIVCSTCFGQFYTHKWA
jgi:hypothetical protein